MKSIFDNSVAPLLKREAGKTKFYESSIEVEGIMESSLAPIIEKAARGNPYVYIKSHPKGEEEIPLVEIHFSIMGGDPEATAKCLEEAKKDLLELLDYFTKRKY